jgi:hypothetical protein
MKKSPLASFSRWQGWKIADRGYRDAVLRISPGHIRSAHARTVSGVLLFDLALPVFYSSVRDSGELVGSASYRGSE